jgi:hypothetical protein
VRLLRPVLVLVTTTALLAACASLPGSSTSAESPSDSPTTATGLGTPLAPAPVTLPEQRLDAGTVSAGAPVTVTGDGPAVLDFVRGGAFGVVARVDCTSCSGPLALTDTEGSVLGAGDPPLSGSYLVDRLDEDEAQRAVVVDAEGPWSVELLAWDDLPVVTGPQQGTGSTVLRLGDATRSVQLAFTPLDAEDILSARAVPESGMAAVGTPGSTAFGADSAVDQPMAVPLPGVVAVATEGAWALTPLG